MIGDVLLSGALELRIADAGAASMAVDGVLDLDDLSPDLLDEHPAPPTESDSGPVSGINPLVGKTWKEIETYIAFWETETGAALNNAMFTSFNQLYDGLSYATARVIALRTGSEEL